MMPMTVKEARIELLDHSLRYLQEVLEAKVEYLNMSEDADRFDVGRLLHMDYTFERLHRFTTAVVTLWSPHKGPEDEDNELEVT